MPNVTGSAGRLAGTCDGQTHLHHRGRVHNGQVGSASGQDSQVQWHYTQDFHGISLVRATQMPLVRVRQSIDSNRGAQVDLRLSAGVFHSGAFNAAIVGQATWANAKSTGSLYAISPQQSAITSLSAYQPGGGLLFTSVGLLWGIDLDPKWMIVGSLENRRLSDNVSRSPLVERRSNRDSSAGLAYHFGNN